MAPRRSAVTSVVVFPVDFTGRVCIVSTFQPRHYRTAPASSSGIYVGSVVRSVRIDPASRLAANQPVRNRPRPRHLEHLPITSVELSHFETFVSVCALRLPCGCGRGYPVEYLSYLDEEFEPVVLTLRCTEQEPMTGTGWLDRYSIMFAVHDCDLTNPIYLLGPDPWNLKLTHSVPSYRRSLPRTAFLPPSLAR